MIHTFKGFSVVSEAEVDVFLEFSCFFYDPTDVGNLISVSSAVSKLGKEYNKVVYCHPAYLTYMQSTSCKMLGWMKHNLDLRLLGDISITSDMITTSPSGRKRRRTKKPLDESERGE